MSAALKSQAGANAPAINTAAEAADRLAHLVGPNFALSAVAAVGDDSLIVDVPSDRTIEGFMTARIMFSDLGGTNALRYPATDVHADDLPTVYYLPDMLFQYCDPGERKLALLVDDIETVWAMAAAGRFALCPLRGVDWTDEDLASLVDMGLREILVAFSNTAAGMRNGKAIAELLRRYTVRNDRGGLTTRFRVWIAEWSSRTEAGYTLATLWSEWAQYDSEKFERGIGALPTKALSIPRSKALEAEKAAKADSWATDRGNASRFVSAYGRDLRYNVMSGKWLRWDGASWAEDKKGHVTELGKTIGRLVLAEAQAAQSEEARKELLAHARDSEARRAIAAALDLARTEGEVPVLPEELDTDDMLLCVENCTIDLRTGQPRAHRREDLITRRARGVIYDSKAKCPKFDAFLADILPDAEQRAFLQRWVGYSLTGLTTEEAFVVAYGTGKNGKSKLLEVLHLLVGELGQTAEFETFMQQASGKVRNDIAALDGARFISASENNQGERLAEGVVKRLTGGDTVRARYLFKEAFDFKPKFKLTLACNYKPVITGEDEGIWRRVILLPFTVFIPEAKRDRQIVEKLRAELPGILNWALRGCLEWQRIGLAVPASIHAATAEYREQSDTLGSFLEDCCELGKGPDFTISTQALYKIWCLWCEHGAGEEPGTLKSFADRLPSKGIGSKKVGGRMYRTGVRVKPTADLPPHCQIIPTASR